MKYESCTEPGCGYPALRDGICAIHKIEKEQGQPVGALRAEWCAVPGCNLPAREKDLGAPFPLCDVHARYKTETDDRIEAMGRTLANYKAISLVLGAVSVCLVLLEAFR